ncbi:KCTD1_15 [Mytilus coruscus]|uniref:KCTD1_15 n=1 Tax=Mytilus coruscus TaxID=42192 RepID=A0A6J8AUP3_MYTCO|nr:KCTD1_15 [Mytilus coruscus]
MTKDTFRLKKDASGMKYIYQNKDELDKNHRANTDPSDSVTEGRMYEKKACRPGWKNRTSGEFNHLCYYVSKDVKSHSEAMVKSYAVLINPQNPAIQEFLQPLLKETINHANAGEKFCLKIKFGKCVKYWYGHYVEDGSGCAYRKTPLNGMGLRIYNYSSPIQICYNPLVICYLLPCWLLFGGSCYVNASVLKFIYEKLHQEVVKNGKRFHVADDDEIEELLQNKDSLNTKKSTAVAVKCFRQFLEESGRENTKFEEYELSELDVALKSFYAGARKSDGSLFKKSAIQNVKYGLKRYLHENRNIDINKDNEFTKSYLIFQAVKVDISEEDLQKLYSGDTPVFDVNPPYGLQFKVWFELMLFL